MKTFIFKVEHSSTVRGYNRTIKVYHVKNNQPIWIGYDDKINTAGYKGDYAVACQVIADECGHKMDKRGYTLESKNIRVLEI